MARVLDHAGWPDILPDHLERGIAQVGAALFRQFLKTPDHVGMLRGKIICFAWIFQ